VSATESSFSKPFHVVTEPGAGFHSGHDTESAATQAANRCNAEAKRLELKTTYKVIDKPDD
jgi:hypothetical protein